MASPSHPPQHNPLHRVASMQRKVAHHTLPSQTAMREVEVEEALVLVVEPVLVLVLAATTTMTAQTLSVTHPRAALGA